MILYPDKTISNHKGYGQTVMNMQKIQGTLFPWTFIKDVICKVFRASLIAQLVKNPPAMQESPVLFLGREDPLEKG